VELGDQREVVAHGRCVAHDPVGSGGADAFAGGADPVDQAGVGFLLPVLLSLLGRAGLLSAATLRKQRRFAIVGIFLAAAFLTPPDPLSQIGLAVPLLLLYEISIWLVAMNERKRAEREAAQD